MFINRMLFMIFGGLMFFSVLKSDSQVISIKKPEKDVAASSTAQTLMALTQTN